MTRAVVVLALVIAPSGLAVPTTAQAGWKIDRALSVANAVWHSPCGGTVRLEFKHLDRWAPEQAVDASDEPPPGWERCVVYLTDRPSRNLRSYDARRDRWSDGWAWEPMCTVVIHGMGHIAGYRDPLNPDDPFHSHRRESVMYWRSAMYQQHGGRWSGVDSRCRERGRRYLWSRG